MNYTLSLKSKVFFGDGLCGLFWIVIGICNICHISKSISTAITTLAIVVIIISLISSFLKSDTEDEMSQTNIQKAESTTFRAISSTIIVLYLLTLTHNRFVTNLSGILPIIYGLGSLIKTRLFILYEKKGN